MRKRLFIIGILLLTLLVIQVYFYSETIARTRPRHIANYVKRINYILEEVIRSEKQNKFERAEMRIEVFNKINNREIRLAENKKESEDITILEEEEQTYPIIEYYTGGHLTPSGGVYWYGEQKETYYNLPMDGVISTAWNNGIKGEYWVRDDGCKMLGSYIILACNRDVHPYGSIVETSLGYGISLDTGGFAVDNPYQVDIAVNW